MIDFRAIGNVRCEQSVQSIRHGVEPTADLSQLADNTVQVRAEFVEILVKLRTAVIKGAARVTGDAGLHFSGYVVCYRVGGVCERG